MDVKNPSQYEEFLVACDLWLSSHKSHLVARGVNIDQTCALCGQHLETMVHVLLKCPVIKRVWHSVPIGVFAFFVDSIVQWWNDISRRFTHQKIVVAVAVL